MNMRMILSGLSIVVGVIVVGSFCRINRCKEAVMPCGCCSSNKSVEEKELKTPSGLCHVVLTAAPENARQAKAGDVVKVHYTGWLLENGQKGAQFDSSLKRGTPFTFELGAQNVIAGWDEGVALMKVGEKRRLIIPGNLAYGEQGFPGVIPPNATLIFDVELLEIRPS
jgi:FKBP-type peptidyl-prolyl cis-trans isomerase